MHTPAHANARPGIIGCWVRFRSPIACLRYRRSINVQKLIVTTRGESPTNTCASSQHNTQPHLRHSIHHFSTSGPTSPVRSMGISPLKGPSRCVIFRRRAVSSGRDSSPRDLSLFGLRGRPRFAAGIGGGRSGRLGMASHEPLCRVGARRDRPMYPLAYSFVRKGE